MDILTRKPKKFIYLDEYGMPVVDVDFPSLKYLGLPPEKLNSKHYRWGAVKLPKGRTWIKDAIVHVDKMYAFSKISLYDNYPELYVKFSPSDGKSFTYCYSKKLDCCVFARFKQGALYLTIKEYEKLFAYQVIDDFINPETGENLLGRHFEEAILTFWKSKHLPFRGGQNVLRSL